MAKVYKARVVVVEFEYDSSYGLKLFYLIIKITNFVYNIIHEFNI